MSPRVSIQPARKQHLTLYTGKLEPLVAADYRFFEEKYGIITPMIQRGDFGMYAMLAMPPTGTDRRAVVLRRPWPGSPLDTGSIGVNVKKALTYQETRGPLQAFYRAHGGKAALAEALVVVEDQLSAMKVSEVGYNAVALLGTPGSEGDLGADRVRELVSYPVRQVVIALDADATANALAFARKWGYAFKNTLRVAILEKDLKDTPKDKILEVLSL